MNRRRTRRSGGDKERDPPLPPATSNSQRERERERTTDVIRRGLRASPELRDGLGATVVLAFVSAAGRVTVPILVQQVIDHEVKGSDLRVASVAPLAAVAVV